MRNRSIAIIGLGNMGGAIADGLIAAGWTVYGYDANPAAYECRDVVRSKSPSSALGSASLCVLAIKPYQFEAFAASIPGVLTPTHTIISVAAGVTIAALKSLFGAAGAHVRTMPNVAATVGRSTTAVLGTTPEAVGLTREVFEAVGSVVELAQESDFHAFTALAGSGPAFAFVFAEALADAAVAEGMPRDKARATAGSMLAGAAELLVSHGGSSAELKDRVTSPGGTTIEGVIALEDNGFRAAAMSAIRRAASRSRSMESE